MPRPESQAVVPSLRYQRGTSTGVFAAASLSELPLELGERHLTLPPTKSPAVVSTPRFQR